MAGTNNYSMEKSFSLQWIFVNHMLLPCCIIVLICRRNLSAVSRFFYGSG